MKKLPKPPERQAVFPGTLTDPAQDIFLSCAGFFFYVSAEIGLGLRGSLNFSESG